ncbi:MAG TPA: hypothetical protein VF649_13555 [Sphingomonas sp.]|jgi:hypothetical protein|uniref:hypothetical protein n=1 Tax=Sphingomonas sp. TaxID=28214 RepID=UPI002ED899E5
MRTSDAALLIGGLLTAGLMTGCDRAPVDPRVAAGAVAGKDAGAGRIACRLGTSATYAIVCTAERTETADGQLLTLRGPDGGFRRILVDADGRSARTADGAEPAMVKTSADGTEIIVAGDHYRLPAPTPR